MDQVILGGAVLLVSVVSAALSSAVAASRNQGGCLWFILGLLLGPFALIIALFLPTRSTPTTHQPQVIVVSAAPATLVPQVPVLPQPASPNPQPSAPSRATLDALDELERLFELKQRGVLTEEEYARMKKTLI